MICTGFPLIEQTNYKYQNMNKILLIALFFLISVCSYSQTRIEAENYTNMSGVSVEDGWGDGSARDIFSIDQGDWMEYSIHPTVSGIHTFIFRIGTITAGAQFTIKKPDGTILATISLPNTSNYQMFQSVTATLNLNAGDQTIRIESSATDNWTFNWFEYSFGYKLEAELYSAMFGIQTEQTTDAGGGLNVGYIDAGDWMDYSVNIATAGTYSIKLRVAAPNSNSALQIINSSGTILKTLNIPNTGSFQSWQTIDETLTLPAGLQTLRIYAQTSLWNINWWALVPAVSNQNPVANAGSDASITLPTSSITLNGSGSDPDGNIYSYLWNYVSGPAGSNLTTPTQATTSVSGLVQGTYIFRLTVADNQGATGFDEVTITVNPAPVASTAWLTGGNNNTDPNVHFIGTNDAMPLIFKTNGIKQAKLTTDGVFTVKKLRVTQTAWADYVFDNTYKLRTLHDVERYINRYKHLPGVPSQKEVTNSGVDVADNQAMLLRKIEELTLYMIGINKEVEKLKKENASLKKKLKTKK